MSDIFLKWAVITRCRCAQIKVSGYAVALCYGKVRALSSQRAAVTSPVSQEWNMLWICHASVIMSLWTMLYFIVVDQSFLNKQFVLMIIKLDNYLAIKCINGIKVIDSLLNPFSHTVIVQSLLTMTGFSSFCFLHILKQCWWGCSTKNKKSK